MDDDENVKCALQLAWDISSAQSSLERWQSLAEREGWDCKEYLPSLVKVFGASWYFTRFIFFRGQDILPLLENLQNTDFSSEAVSACLQQLNFTGDTEEDMEVLRCAKNEIMLQLLTAKLEGHITQPLLEKHLTTLAEVVLKTTLKLLDRDNQDTGKKIAIMAMGRMAGQEMNFGSDLDLIFLYSKQDSGEQSQLIRYIQKLQRYIAMPSPAGNLYDIDMRLRPHGTSGTLISPVEYFLEFHSAERETWERQMMTRCRVIHDPGNLTAVALEQVSDYVYKNYDENLVRQDVLSMRARVQNELGCPAGKFEIKRGKGGIMDIDFISHFLQLCHGYKHHELKTTSTRDALSKLKDLGLLSQQVCYELLKAYDFLKTVEGVLRVADMKNISAFSREARDLKVLSRAMGFRNDKSGKQAEAFLEKYRDITNNVRQHFINVVGELPD